MTYLWIRGRRRALGPPWDRRWIQCSSRPLQPSGPLRLLKWNPDTNLTRGTQRSGARAATKYLACQNYTEPAWFWLESARHLGVWGLSSCTWRTDHTSVEDGGERQKASGARAWCALDFPHFRPPFLCCRNSQVLIWGAWWSRAKTWVWPLIVLFISWVTFKTITDGQYRNQTDYILCSCRWRSSIQSAKTRPAADCGSDHELHIANFRLKFKKVGETTRPFRYDLNQIPYNYTVEVRNRLNGLYLVDRVPEKLRWRFVTWYRRWWPNRLKKKKYKQAKWLSEEALQIAEKRREAKGKGERERYTQLSAELQRTARKNKKPFLSE